MKIATIVDPRPKFIKCAPLSRETRKIHQECTINTSLHYDYKMSKSFFDELDIPEPDYNINMGSSSRGRQTGTLLGAIEDILIKERERPQIVGLFGDTNSSLACALAATKLGILVAHVEARLPSYNCSILEELNWVLTDHISNLLFVPTVSDIDCLRKESILKGFHKAG